MPLRIVVLASGSGSNMVSLTKKCQAGLVDGSVVMVVTDKPGAPCIAKAQDLGVPVTLELPVEPGETRADYDARLRDAVASESPDVVVLAGFMRILTPTFVDDPGLAGHIVNIHPALLPSFKGAHGVRDSLAAGVKLAGCTTHLVTAELDGGPILLQAAVPVMPDDDQETLAARVLAAEHWLLPRTVHLQADPHAPSWQGRDDIPDGVLWSPGF